MISIFLILSSFVWLILGCYAEFIPSWGVALCLILQGIFYIAAYGLECDLREKIKELERKIQTMSQSETVDENDFDGGAT